MVFVKQKEEPNSPSKFLKSTLKHFAFASRQTLNRTLPSQIADEEFDPITDYDQRLFDSVIRRKYMEVKSRRQFSTLSLDIYSFNWALTSTQGESFAAPKKLEKEEGSEREEFFSVGSNLSRCSSSSNMEAFVSARSNLSRCSSLNGLDDFPRHLWIRRSIIQELSQCDGWPFGLCRKALLLPPLPKSPAESWSWRKSKSTLK